MNNILQDFGFKVTMKRGNFDRSGSFVKGAMVPIQKSHFVADAFIEIND